MTGQGSQGPLGEGLESLGGSPVLMNVVPVPEVPLERVVRPVPPGLLVWFSSVYSTLCRNKGVRR